MPTALDGSAAEVLVDDVRRPEEKPVDEECAD